MLLIRFKIFEILLLKPKVILITEIRCLQHSKFLRINIRKWKLIDEIWTHCILYVNLCINFISCSDLKRNSPRFSNLKTPIYLRNSMTKSVTKKSLVFNEFLRISELPWKNYKEL